jgi:hypothetical protein
MVPGRDGMEVPVEPAVGSEGVCFCFLGAMGLVGDVWRWEERLEMRGEVTRW